MASGNSILSQQMKEKEQLKQRIMERRTIVYAVQQYFHNVILHDKTIVCVLYRQTKI